MRLKTLLPILLALLLAGCSSAFPDEYISVKAHEAPFAYRGTVPDTASETQAPEAPRTVSRAYDIREAIQDLVMSGQERGAFLVSNYAGVVEEDMKEMFNALLSDSPKYTYAMDSFDWTLDRRGEETWVQVEMKLRLTPQELLAIETHRFPSPALEGIYEALCQQVSTYTVQVSGYQDTDLNALLEDYMLYHPDQVAEAPGISTAVYPDRGKVRVLEVHFVYHTDRETLRQRNEDTRAFLNLIANQLNEDRSPEELVDSLYMHLVPLIGYESAEDATVYTQVVRKVGSSRTMASVVQYLCSRVGFQSEIVVGEKDGNPWYWNRIVMEGQWYSFDLHSAALQGESPVLHRAEEMTGYTWDPQRYPEREEPEPPEPPEPTQEPTEPTEITNLVIGLRQLSFCRGGSYPPEADEPPGLRSKQSPGGRSSRASEWKKLSTMQPGPVSESCWICLWQIAFVPNAGRLTLTGKSRPYSGYAA